MRKGRGFIIFASIVIALALLFSLDALLDSLRFSQVFSHIYHDPIHVVGGMDVYVNGTMYKENLAPGQWRYDGSYGFSDTFTFTVDLATFPYCTDPTLCFRSRSSEVHVYQGSRLVYSLESTGGQDPAAYNGGRYNLVELDPQAMDEYLTLVFETSYITSAPLFDPVFFANRTTLVTGIVARNMPSLLIGMSMVSTALLIAFLSLTLPNRRIRSNLMSAVFLIALTGIWILMQNWSRQLFISNVSIAQDVSYLMMALLPGSMLQYIMKNYDMDMQYMRRIFVPLADLFLVLYVLMYVPFLFMGVPLDGMLSVISIGLLLYFIALLVFCLLQYLRSGFSGGVPLMAGIAAYMCAIALEQTLLSLESPLRLQLAIYLPYYIALFIFLFRATGEAMRNSHSSGEKRRIMEMSFTDPLTGLLNRSALDNRLERISRERRDNIYIFMIDVDGMKSYNDDFGHKAGDDLLIAMAESIREATVALNRYIFRYGGDEFLLMVEEAGVLDTDAVVQRIRENFRRLMDRANADFSVGVVRYDISMRKDIMARLNEADARMYYDKRGEHGKGTSTPPRRK